MQYLSMPIINDMKGYTVAEMAEILKINEGAVRVRLSKKEIKPITHSPIYPESALEAIRNVPGKGRPKKQSEPKPEKLVTEPAKPAMKAKK